MIDPRAQIAQHELVQRELARKSLIAYAERFIPGYSAGWAHKLVAANLERFYEQIKRKESPRLMLFLPPRFGKSKLASQLFPSWVLGDDPTFEFIVASYATSLPMDFSRYIKGLLGDPAYQVIFPDTKLDPKAQATDGWYTTENGTYFPAGVGSGITGRGCQCILPYCTISTREGIIPIQDVKVNDEVLAYDHRTNERVWTRVRAVSASLSSERIIDIGGIETTEDHQRFARGKGYLKSSEIQHPRECAQVSFNLPEVQQRILEESGRCKQGPTKRKLLHVLRRSLRWPPGKRRKEPLQSLSFLRGQEGRTRTELHPLFKERSERGSHSAALHSMRERIYQKSGGNGESKQAGGQYKTSVLFSSLFYSVQKGAHHREEKEQMQTVWRTGKERLLHSPLLLAISKRAQEVREICRQLFSIQNSYSTATGGSVRYVHSEIHADADTPRRSRPRKSEPRKLSPSLYAMPQSVSSTAGRSAKSLKKDLSGEGAYVVDLQTETGNFFVAPKGVNSFRDFQSTQHLTLNCLIIDDPVKDAEQADSETVLEKAWDWYGSTAMTRVAPGGGILCIQTRWTDLDLSGRLLNAQIEQEKELVKELRVAENKEYKDFLKKEIAGIEKWDVISFPAMAEHDEYITPDLHLSFNPEPGFIKVRSKGDAVHPARYDEAALMRIKKAISPRHWNSLYQQNPVPEEGGFFTRSYVRHHDVRRMPEFPVLQAWDFAIGTKNTNDWTVGITGFIDYTGMLHVIDIVRFRGGTLEIVTAMCDQIAMHSPFLVGIERGQISMAIMPILEEELRARRLHPVIDNEMLSVQDKVVRARPLQGMFQRGMISINTRYPWLEELVQELLRFPHGTYDDQVDTLAMLAKMALETPLPMKTARQRNKSWKDKINQLVNPQSHRSHMGA